MHNSVYTIPKADQIVYTPYPRRIKDFKWGGGGSMCTRSTFQTRMVWIKMLSHLSEPYFAGAFTKNIVHQDFFEGGGGSWIRH